MGGYGKLSKAVHTAAFLRSMKNTLIISGLNLLFGFTAPILFAILLNEMQPAAL